MNKLLLTAFAVLLLLPAMPGGAQDPSTSPSPSPSASPTPDATLNQATTDGPGTQVFAGRSNTRGLSLTLGGQGLRTGITTTNIASDETDACAGVACATAAGAAEPLGTTVTATAPGNPTPEPAEAGNLAAFEGALNGRFGVASATASATPSAEARADGVQDLDVTLTQTIVSGLPPELTGGINEGLQGLADGLTPVAEGDPTGAIQGLLDTLTTLLDDLANGPLLTIHAAPGESDSVITDGVVTSTARSGGVIITLLPTPESTALLPEGLAVIEIGSSQVSATADGTNPATGEATGSIGRITLLPGILDALPDINPSEDLPIQDIIDALPPELTDALGLGGGDGEGEGEPSEEPSDGESEGEGGNPVTDILPLTAFMQADEESAGLVIDLETGLEQICILEDTPLASCVTLGGTSQTVSDDGLGIGVLAAGTDVSLVRDETGAGAVELSIARSEAGAAAAFVQAPTPTPTPTPTRQTGTPETGGGSALVLPAVALMAVGATAMVGLRRRRP